MTQEGPEDSLERTDDVSVGRASDDDAVFESWPQDIRTRFELHSYRGGATILANAFPEQFGEILNALRKLSVTRDMIRTPGGSRGPIAHHVDTLFNKRWREARIAADLHVALHHPKTDQILSDYVRKGYLDGHRIDFVNGKVALDLEWNSKDQTYDRDLYAFSAFHQVGAIDVGVILTRGASLDNAFFRGLGRVLNRDGTEGSGMVYKKFGASTTWMGKLLYRLDAGRNGGCPVVAIGITPGCITDSLLQA